MCVSLFLHLAMYLLFYCQPFFATHAALSPFLIGRTFVREHCWEYWANILVLNWANFCFANIVRVIRPSASKLFSGSKKLRSTFSGNIRPVLQILPLIG